MGRKRKNVAVNEDRASDAKKAEEAFDAKIQEMRKIVRQDRKYQLLFYWHIGHHAHEILSPNNRKKYGHRKIDDIAAAVGWKRDNLATAMQFRRIASEAVVKELQNCDNATWRVVSQWCRVKDAKKRQQLYGDILSGKITSTNVDEYLRDKLQKGPKIARVPNSARGIFSKWSMQANALCVSLNWADNAFELFSSVKDENKRDELEVQLRETTRKLKELSKKVAELLERHEALAVFAEEMED